MERQCNAVRHGIIPRKRDKQELFENCNVNEWVIHQVIDWMDNIKMQRYSKFFANFEKPMSGIKLLDVHNIYLFRLEIDFEIETNDALKIMLEIEKLRQYLPIDPTIIDYVESGKWLEISFKLLGMKYLK